MDDAGCCCCVTVEAANAGTLARSVVPPTGCDCNDIVLVLGVDSSDIVVAESCVARLTCSLKA